MPPTVSTRNGIDGTWSRCECVTKMWSICVSSASDRSPTPEPASSSTSWSTRKDVVRGCPPPIPPEQPSTRRRIVAGLFFVEAGDAVPVGRRGRAAPFGHFPGKFPVQPAVGAHALQLEQVDVGLVPLLRAVGAQHLLPEPQFLLHARADLALQAERLADGDGRAPALDAGPVDLAEQHVLDRAARCFA